MPYNPPAASAIDKLIFWSGAPVDEDEDGDEFDLEVDGDGDRDAADKKGKGKTKARESMYVALTSSKFVSSSAVARSL